MIALNPTTRTGCGISDVIQKYVDARSQKRFIVLNNNHMKVSLYSFDSKFQMTQVLSIIQGITIATRHTKYLSNVKDTFDVFSNGYSVDDFSLNDYGLLYAELYDGVRVYPLFLMSLCET